MRSVSNGRSWKAKKSSAKKRNNGEKTNSAADKGPVQVFYTSLCLPLSPSLCLSPNGDPDSDLNKDVTMYASCRRDIWRQVRDGAANKRAI